MSPVDPAGAGTGAGLEDDRRRELLTSAAAAKQPSPGGGSAAVFGMAVRLVAWDPALAASLEARSEKGEAKYLQPLRTCDGRNSRQEQFQKALDGFVYSVKDYLEGPGSLDVVAAWIYVLRTCADVVATTNADTRQDAAAVLRGLEMTSEQIGTALGVHPVTVRKWRSGEGA